MQFSEMIEGLQILAKYEKRGLEAHLNGADHDIIWASTAQIDYDAPPIFDEYGDEIPVDMRVSTEDAQRLSGLGWHIDEDSESWSHCC